MTWDVIEKNPLLKAPLLHVLATVKDNPNTKRTKIEQLADETRNFNGPVLQQTSTFVDILVRGGALIEQIYVNDEPYSGTLQQLQTDASVTESASILQILQITKRGLQILDSYSASNTLRELLQNDIDNSSVYHSMLVACSSQVGVSLSELEQLIDKAICENQQLDSQISQSQTANNAQTRIYPQYFIDSLEKSGGIYWNGNWKTTDAGKLVIKQTQVSN
jgi:hypothetical protein